MLRLTLQLCVAVLLSACVPWGGTYYRPSAKGVDDARVLAPRGVGPADTLALSRNGVEILVSVGRSSPLNDALAIQFKVPRGTIVTARWDEMRLEGNRSIAIDVVRQATIAPPSQRSGMRPIELVTDTFDGGDYPQFDRYVIYRRPPDANTIRVVIPSMTINNEHFEAKAITFVLTKGAWIDSVAH